MSLHIYCNLVTYFTMVQTCASKRKSAEAESVNGTRDGTEELSQKVTSPKAPSESPKRRKLNGTKEAKQKSEELAAKQDAEEHDVTAQDVKAQDGKEQVAKVQDAEEQRAKQPDAEEPDAKEEGAKLRTTGKRDAENGSNGQQDAEDQDDEEGFADFTEAMDAEKRAWQGFCEIESEPVSISFPYLIRCVNAVTHGSILTLYRHIST